MQLELTQFDIDKMCVTHWPGCFVHEQEGRFEYIDCEPDDIHDFPNVAETKNHNGWKNDIFLAYPDSRAGWLEALIVRDWYRGQGRKAYILWDMADNPEPQYCVWVGEVTTASDQS